MTDGTETRATKIAARPRHQRPIYLLLALLVAGCASSGGAEPAPTTSPEGAEQTGPPEPPAEELLTATIHEGDPMPDPVPDPSLVPAAGGFDPDTVMPGRFDGGRMWTFEYPPIDYFRSTYGIEADTDWFGRARLAALRIPGCSASFVSRSGLLATNHHCARDHVSAVAEEGETLLDDGFYAVRLEDERAVEDFTADQLIDILDVTDEVYAAIDGIDDDAARSEARQSKLDEIEQRLLDERGGEDAGWHVEMISLYQGGRYSAYVFRRYTDVRLVMAPELELGSFGGDPDNFTYPRYSLDFAFFRVYDDGRPLDSSDHYFRWDTDGAGNGDAVFVIGNPGSTSRIQTVAELAFRRDVSDQALLDFLDSRIETLQEYYESDPETAESLDLRNDIFSLQNSQKAYRGIIRGLHDPAILARKQAYERNVQQRIEADPELSAEYGGLVKRMAEIQQEKRGVAPGFGSFLALTSPVYSGATMTRAIYAFQYLNASMGGAPAEQIEELESEFLEVRQQPAELEELLLEARFHDLIRNYGEDDRTVQQILGGRTPEGAAAVIVNGSVLADSASAAAALADGTLEMSDPAMAVFRSLIGLLGPFQQAISQLSTEEEEIGAKLGRARFDIFGSEVPPDATFSLRIADGVVDGYAYNGTRAPTLTTYYGLYDRYYSHRSDDWDLPDRWKTPPASMDLSTPLNFVSTADIIGGNSGSPVVNRDLEVVGLAFDGNIESLTGDYIFLTESPRTVAVDSRGILEALDEIYDADRIVEELMAGAGVR